MDGYLRSTYGDGFADVYDDWYRDLPEPASCARYLATLSPTGPVLELGIGTGRLAFPLASSGMTVVGIDASSAMLERLTHKAVPDRTDPTDRRPGPVLAVRGDMSELPLAPGSIPVALAAFNTLFNLTTESAQHRCLTEIARVLERGGALVVEAIVPPDAPGRVQDVSIKELDLDQVILTASVLDPTTQTITGQHIQFTESGTQLRPWLLRYLTPVQLDAATASVGLELVSRWADWSGSVFDDHATAHVSTYRKPAS